MEENLEGTGCKAASNDFLIKLWHVHFILLCTRINEKIYFNYFLLVNFPRDANFLRFLDYLDKTVPYSVYKIHNSPTHSEI